MTTKSETQKVVSIGMVSCDGKNHDPGMEWDCPAGQVGRLVEVGAVRLATRPVDANEQKRPAAKDAIAQLATIDSIEELDVVESYEARKTVLEAIAARRAELESE